MSETVEEKYLRKKGLACPFCESPDIIARPPRIATMYAWAQVHCPQCKGEWSDLYHLVGIEVVSRPKEVNDDGQSV